LFSGLNFALVLLFVAIALSSSPLSNALNSAIGTAAMGLISLLLNVGLLIYFGFTRYWVALGALVVCSIWFVFVLMTAPQCFGLDPTVVNNANGLRSMLS
jgi:hypothetical protein